MKYLISNIIFGNNMTAQVVPTTNDFDDEDRKNYFRTFVVNELWLEYVINELSHDTQPTMTGSHQASKPQLSTKYKNSDWTKSIIRIEPPTHLVIDIDPHQLVDDHDYTLPEAIEELVAAWIRTHAVIDIQELTSDEQSIEVCEQLYRLLATEGEITLSVDDKINFMFDLSDVIGMAKGLIE